MVSALCSNRLARNDVPDSLQSAVRDAAFGGEVKGHVDSVGIQCCAELASGAVFDGGFV